MDFFRQNLLKIHTSMIGQKPSLFIAMVPNTKDTDKILSHIKTLSSFLEEH